jgi:16S rRNA (adenine1518-N6/adenine1519-N6)-dimethyltransferase
VAFPVQIRPSKRLGQNFLTDNRVASRIVSVAELGTEDTVLEPGAGYGTLTHLLEHRAGRVIAVEKDRRLASQLRKEFEKSSSVSIIEGDVLKVELPPFNKVVGTPPYAVSSKLVLFLTKRKFDLASLVFQKEFGERLVAKPGTSDYGRLSIAAQRSLTIQPITNVSSGAFRPRPKVDSVLLRILPRKIGDNVDEKLFEELVRGLFNQRRRLVRSSLLHFLSKKLGRDKALATIKTVDVSEKRVFQLTMPDLEDLCRQLSDALGNNSELA